MKKRIKINGWIIFSAVLLIIIFPKTFFRRPNLSFLNYFCEAIGVSLILMGQLLRISARGFKAENSQSGNALIIDGPYTLVRNPMYLGIFLIGSGAILVLFRWWVMGTFVGIFFLRYRLLTGQEEKKLLVNFPNSYPDYCQRVPRFFPSMKKVFMGEIAVNLPIKLAWLKREASSVIAVLLSTFIFKASRVIGNDGLGVYLQEFIFFTILILLFLYFIIHLDRMTKFLNRDAAGKN